MSNKVWHRALHDRKIWKELSISKKTCYYFKPFVDNLLEIWYQPLPFPTILKVLQSLIVVLIALLPIIYPTLLFLWTYAELQFVLSRHFGIQFPSKLDLIKSSAELLEFKVTNESHSMFLSLYLERWRLIGTAITSSIDYFRMACYLLLGFGEE